MATAASWMSRRTPRQLAALAFAGSLLLPLALLGNFFSRPLPAIATFVLLAAGGGILDWRAEKTLKQQIQSGSLSQETLDAVRGPLQIIGPIVSMVFVVGAFIVMMDRLIHHRHFGAELVFFLFPLQTATRLTSMFQPPRLTARALPLSLSTMKPISSEHWGERGPAH